MFKNDYKKPVPNCFMNLLVLASKCEVELHQEDFYGPITLEWA